MNFIKNITFGFTGSQQAQLVRRVGKGVTTEEITRTGGLRTKVERILATPKPGVLSRVLRRK